MKENEEKNIEKKEKESIEERTIEELLKDLRISKKWSYLNVVVELNKLGIITTEKKIKKWEYGLEYPDLDTIYKLSEIYFVPSDNFIVAKGNSFEKGYNSIHMTFIKWFCYLTGATLKVGYVAFYVVLTLAVILSLMYFVDQLGKVDKDLI